jgi:hypothetical protein
MLHVALSLETFLCNGTASGAPAASFLATQLLRLLAPSLIVAAREHKTLGPKTSLFSGPD